MNRDTPDAVPSDDFPFLGPAVSPRRREAGSTPRESGELAGPFVGGAFGAREEPVAAETGDDLPDSGAWNPERTPTSDEAEPTGPGAENGIPEFEAEDDDFPWLSREESAEGAEEPVVEPWRATGEVDELTSDDRAVEHFSWIGAPSPEPQAEGGSAGAPGGDESDLEDEADEEPWYQLPEDGTSAAGYGWEDESVTADASLSGLDREDEAVEDEREGFRVDAENAEDSWPEAEAWSQEIVGEPGEGESVQSGAGAPVGEPASPEVGFSWEETARETERTGAEEVTGSEGRWDADPSFQVEGETHEVHEAVTARVDPGAADSPTLDAEAAGTDTAESPLVERGTVGAGTEESAPVDAEPLPLGEWEELPGVAAVESGRSPEGAAGDALSEVADRLEQIARSLRSGRAVQAIEEGDPLQLLITGYALGFSEARRQRR